MKSPDIVDGVERKPMQSIERPPSVATIGISHEADTPATTECGAIGAVLNKLGKNTLIYSFSTILSQVIAFVMIPIYTHHLSPSDYGIIELLNLTTYIVAMIVGAGMSSAIIRFYYEYDDIKHRNQVVSTAIFFVTLITIISMIFVYHFRYDISKLVFSNTIYASYLQVILFTMYINIINELVLSYIKAKQNSIQYNIYSLIKLVFGLSLNIYLIVFLGMGVWGVLYSGLISSLIMFFILIPTTLIEVKISLSFSKLKELLKYGLPLIPSGMGMFVLNFADRFFLQKYAPLSSVGTYSLGYKFGMIISALILSPFLQFWSAYMFEVEKKENAKYLFSRIHLYLSCILVFFTVCLSIFSDEIVKFLTPREYWQASGIIPIITASYVFSGFHYFFSLGHILKKKTKRIAYCVSCSAIISIALNFVMVPLYNEYGAAWSTFLSFLFMSLMSLTLSQRIYKIDYEYVRLFKLSIAGFSTIMISIIYRFILNSYGILFNTTLILIFPFLLYMMRFYREDEIKAVKNFVKLKIFKKAINRNA